MKMLDSHPDILCEGELLEFRVDNWIGVQNKALRTFMKYPPLRSILRRTPRPYLELRRRFRGQRVYGFKVFLSHLAWPSHALPSLHAHGWKIIHLVRENVLEQSLSLLVATSTDHWHRLEKKDGTEISTVQLDPDEVVSEVGRRLDFQARESLLLADIDHFRINYEKDLASEKHFNAVSQKLQRYIGVPNSQMSSALSRTYDRKYRDIVSNYDEIEQAVAESGLPCCFGTDLSRPSHQNPLK